MRYEVPFIPDTAYASLLSEHVADVSAVYFRLGPQTPDARLPGCGDVSPQELAEGLAALPDVPRLGLLNAAFHAPDVLSGDGLRDLILLLEGYLAAGTVTGIVYADQYLLTALSDAAPDVAGALMAYPSINFRLDRFERVAAILEAIADTHFALPDALLLDRDLNRDPDRLSELAGRVRRSFSGLQIGLMVNEGCLYACPYKTAHDAHIALSRLAACSMDPDVNREIGCLRAFVRTPGRLLALPFVRPEDVPRLEGVADFVKICGRTRPAADLTGVVSAYLAGAFAGNLLWLLDTPEILSGRLSLENNDLPEDFFERVNGCSRLCRECGYCGDLAAALVQERGLALPRLQTA